MMIENLNLTDSELDKFIYRIIPYDRFIDNLEKKENILIRPKLWDDPFENILSLQVQNNVFQYDKYFIYAQCWTFSEESDLLWRAYSSNKESVKLRSTPRKLINSIINSKIISTINSNPKIVFQNMDDSITEGLDGFIGKVKYLSNKRLIDLLKKAFCKCDYDGYYETLLLKRHAFKSENELRIGIRYFFGFNDIQILLSDDFFKYDVEIFDMVDEIVFDPRISDFKYNALKSQIQQYGYPHLVYKSNLYEIPSITNILKK